MTVSATHPALNSIEAKNSRIHQSVKRRDDEEYGGGVANIEEKRNERTIHCWGANITNELWTRWTDVRTLHQKL